jgi:RNA binding exosome subunit
MSKRSRIATIVAASLIFGLAPGQLRADDFGKIVHQIEANYHVHRNLRFVMGFAGVLVKCTSPFTGVKGFKMALFEDHPFASNPDSNLDEVIQSAGDHGWQSIIKSYSRHSDEHTYIYARQEKKDLKLLVVNVEPGEAVVIQVKINPEKLAKFLDKYEVGGHSVHEVGGAMAFR